MSRDKRSLLGDAPRLPLSVAIQVAWTSIRVRMSRSLVTVSSVVLAVAFLLVVVGENLANRAVWRGFAEETQPLADLQAVRALADKARDPLDLLQLLADDGAAASAWVESQTGAPMPPLDATTATLALKVARWIEELKPSHRFLVIRNRTPDEWLLALDAQAVEALVKVSRDLPGITLPASREDLDKLAAQRPALERTVAALISAEDARLAAISANGGGEAILDRILAGADRAEIAAGGMPLGQALPTLDDARWQALRRQLRMDRARSTAVDIVRRLNERDPAHLLAADVRDWRGLAAKLRAQIGAAGDNPGKRLVAAARGQGDALLLADDADASAREAAIAAINTALGDPAFFTRDAWTGISLPDAASETARRDQMRERQLTRFNRALFDAAYAGLIAPMNATAPEPLELAQLATGDQADHPLAGQLDERLRAALPDLPLADLWADQRRRARLEALGATFTGIDYNPERAATRTFWLVALSLLVCIVGIVNTMMMAVTERFREIATMKCLGAMDSFILKAFLIESGATGSVGSLIGALIGLALALTQSATRFGSSFWQAFPARDYALAALGALVCGMVLAVLGALLPALKAARMHPIEAMRIDA
ncbi:MAG TPA: ABC transporter permease [Planctomycetota bacterium]|nr:ABC transporter permease [Planctomycetota bacterium]